MVLLTDVEAECHPRTSKPRRLTTNNYKPQPLKALGSSRLLYPQKNPGLDKLDEAPEAHLSNATLGACLDMMFRILGYEPKAEEM